MLKVEVELVPVEDEGSNNVEDFAVVGAVAGAIVVRDPDLLRSTYKVLAARS